MNDTNYLQEAWPRLSPPEKRQIVECITNKIVIAKNEITIATKHWVPGKGHSHKTLQD